MTTWEVDAARDEVRLRLEINRKTQRGAYRQTREGVVMLNVILFIITIVYLDILTLLLLNVVKEKKH